MKLALLIYLASVVNGISLVIILSGLGLAAFGICKVINANRLEPRSYYRCDSDKAKDEVRIYNESLPEKKSKALKVAKVSIISCFCFWLFAALIPAEKTIYLMAGAYATEQIASNERVQKIGSDVLEVIETKLTELKETEK